MTEQEEQAKEAIAYLINNRGGTMLTKDFIISLTYRNFTHIQTRPNPIMENPAFVAEVPKEIMEKPAWFPPLPLQAPLPPLPPLPPPLTIDLKESSTDLQSKTYKILSDAFMNPHKPPTIGGAGTYEPMKTVVESLPPWKYDSMESRGIYIDKIPSQSFVSGVKRSYETMKKEYSDIDSSNIDSSIIINTIEYKWIIKNYPTKIKNVNDIEKIKYNSYYIFNLKRHRHFNCIFILFSKQIYNDIIYDFKFNSDILFKAFTLYLKKLVENSSDDILKSIIDDEILSKYYSLHDLYNAKEVEYFNGAIFINMNKSHKRFRRD